MKLTSTQIDSDGIPFVEWEEESLLLANSRYRFSLISRFGDRRPTLLEIREWCSKAWSLTGKISLSALKKGLIWIHFECEENKVLEKGQYWVWKTAMFLHRWCPGLDLDELLLSAWVVGYEMSGVEEIYFSSKKHTKNVIMESAEDGLWETPVLPNSGSLNSNFFSWSLKITRFPVSSSVLAAGITYFPS